ncbi:hypothetical protein FAZ78_14250 [Cereibacter changlensis]|uniref:Uncharacterized protein n=1 Tax=Cereibacter changlensis TaxID=402884 RepID=A0A4U0YVX0_9RHOB|nr:hypothetical protein [Cereibacter changlensis]TKA95935.1 hypothetical protein FAZ78_14250 [Cereibacter changlensis]
MDLLSGLAAIQQTLAITKELRNIDSKIDTAEFKLRLADLVERLLEAREALTDAKESERDLRQRILELEKKIAERGQFEDENGLLFQLNDEGQRIGQPYCNLCYVRDGKLFRLRHREAKYGASSHYFCDNCPTIVLTGPPLSASKPRADGRTA